MKIAAPYARATLVALVAFAGVASVTACADPNAVAGPPIAPNDAPTANDPDTTASAAGESAQPAADAGRSER